MNRYFIYTRKSTDEADRQVLSIESQLHELRELAKKEGLTVVDVLSESQTAKQPGRPVFNAMMRRVEKGEAQGILAWHPDRLARNAVDGGQVIHLIDTGKLLQLRFPIYWFEPTPQGKFMLAIAFGQSKYYVDNLAENVKRGLRAKARKGLWPTTAPFGYRNDVAAGSIYPDPAKAPFVRKVFELYSTGRYSLEELADHLNRSGLAPKQKHARLISRSNVQYLLTNPIYYGLVRWQGEDHEGTHEPIIPKKLFDRVQTVMSERKRCTRGRPLKDYVFRGVFKCGECGCLVTAQTTKGHNYYHCTRRRRACYQPFLREEVLKQLVRAEIKKFAIPDDWADFLLEKLAEEKRNDTQSSGRSAQALRDQIAQVDERLSRLVDAYLAEEVDREVYLRKRGDLVAQKMDLKAALEGLGRNGDDRFKPATDFVNWSKTVKEHISSGDYRGQAAALQKACSNLEIMGKRIRASVDPNYSFSAKTRSAKKSDPSRT
jgi:site-specific DNA recombinase